MLKPILLAAIASLGVSAPTFAQECLHGPDETATERARREQAVLYAQRCGAIKLPSRPDISAPR